MILRPDATPANTNRGYVTAWQAIARAEKIRSPTYHLVRQPDHAGVSGDIARHLAIAGAPRADDDIVGGISLHDEGWKNFDDGSERLRATPANYSSENVALNADGKPLSFLDIKAGDFLRAWRGSIDSAESVGPIAGLIVSGHFCRIARFGISMAAYSGDDARSVRDFLASEAQRHRRLLSRQSRDENQVQYWIDVLQFCDLLSLYLCCGSRESVEFPQRIGPGRGPIQLQAQDTHFLLSPAVFAREVELSVGARSYPAETATLPITIRWHVR